MTTKNTEAQRAYKKRMRAAGFIPFHVWIKPEWKNTITEVINRLTAGEQNYRRTSNDQ